MQLLVVLLIGESLTRINSCSIYMQRELGNSSQSHNSPLHFVTAHRNLVQKYGGKLFTHMLPNVALQKKNWLINYGDELKIEDTFTNTKFLTTGVLSATT